MAAQSMRMALPLSVYATPGVRARGFDRLLPVDHPKYPGLKLAFVANTPDMRDVSPPCFGFLTVKNRKKGGGKPERGAILILSVLHVPGPARPDIVAVVGPWLIDKSDAEIYYGDDWTLERADCASVRDEGTEAVRPQISKRSKLLVLRDH